MRAGRILDITRPLSAATAPWPGDVPFELDWTLRQDRGDSVNVAAIRMSVHCGTHVDGPLHTRAGSTAGALPLGPFIGPALVVDARAAVEGGPPMVGAAALDGIDAAATPRVLLRTLDRVDAAVFPDPYPALSPALCRRLVDGGFTLVGTDAPSVDPFDSKDLEAHGILVDGGVPNLENLDLSGVAPGRYTLVALPLPLSSADSAPVRAVLIEAAG